MQLENLRAMQEIRQYEEIVFQKYRTQDITLRKKGRLEFKDFTLQESINYLKYDISSVEDTLRMVQL